MVVRNVVLAFLALLAVVTSAPGQEWARKMFPTTSHDFGTVARGAKAEFAFELTNIYEEDVHIAGVRSSCGCTMPTITAPTLKTWEKGAIVAAYNTKSFLGQKNATITVTIDKPYFAEVQLTVDGFIRSDVVFDPGAVDFGEVDQGSSAERKIRLTYAGRSTWQITDVRSANPNLEVEILDNTRTTGRVTYDLLVRLKPGTPAGYLHDELTLISDDRQMGSIPLSVEGRVVPALTVSPASLFLGVLDQGQKVTKQLVVRGNQPFSIQSVKCDNNSFQFDVPNGAKKLHFVPISFTAGSHPGKVAQSIEIKTDLNGGAAASCTATATVK